MNGGTAGDSAAPADVALLEDETYDPFEAFAQFSGAHLVPNPYPRWAELRREGPIHDGDIWKTVGLLNPAGYVRGAADHALLTYDGCVHVFRNPQIFSSTIHAQTMGFVMGHSILEMDDPEHRRYRELVEQAFTRRAMTRWESSLIRPVVDEFIDAFIDRGSADLVREFAFPFPMHVIIALLGLPDEEKAVFHRLAFMLTNMGDFPRAKAASAKLYGYLDDIIERRREKPGTDDIVSALIAAELEGHRLSNEEIIAFLRLLLPAGSETTYHSFSNLMFGLLTHPEQLEAVRHDRKLVPHAAEEGFRWEPPLTGIPRLVMEDTEVAGKTVHQGDLVHTIIGSANHDEARWGDPENFDIFRPQRPHVAFAFGAHVCLGQQLARIETNVALNALLDRLPDLRLDPDAEDVRIEGLVFRGPHALPVVFST
jgi:cytochrome P450